MARKLVQVEERESSFMEKSESSERTIGRVTEVEKGKREGLKTKGQLGANQTFVLGIENEETEVEKCSCKIMAGCQKNGSAGTQNLNNGASISCVFRSDGDTIGCLCYVF